METSRRVDQQNISLAGFRRGNRVVYDGIGIRAFLSGDDIHLRAVRPGLQLWNRCRAEGIRGCDDNLFALMMELGGELADGRRLADPVNADDEDDGLSVLKFVGVFFHLHLLAEAVNHVFLAVRRLFEIEI